MGIQRGDSGAGGELLQVINDKPAGTESNSNTSYAAVTGISQANITTSKTGDYLFMLSTSGYGSAALIATYRIVIDKGTGSEQILGDSDVWDMVQDGVHHHASTFMQSVTLTIGVHTVDLEVKVDTSTVNRNTNHLTQVFALSVG